MSRMLLLFFSTVLFLTNAKEETKIAQAACKLLGSCIEQTGDLFAQCDKILTKEKPVCWNETRDVVSHLRKQTKAENRHVSTCLGKLDPLATILTPVQVHDCRSMLAHLPYSWGTKKRPKRTPPKGWVKFYMCIRNAQRTAHMCKQLAKCCPMERKCKWEQDLDISHVAAVKLKMDLFQSRQNCLKKLLSKSGDDQPDLDYWGFLDDQDIWQI